MFDNRHWPVDKDGLASFGNEEINELFQHHKELFIDTNREAVFEHWLDLKIESDKSPGLGAGETSGRYVSRSW